VPTTDKGSGSRERILAAAAQVAAEYGYVGTTISRVTKRSGLPASSVYWYFKDKDELMAEVIRHSFGVWLGRQPDWADVPREASLETVLPNLLKLGYRSLRDLPEFFRIGLMLTLETRNVEAWARRRYLAIRRSVVTTIEAWFREAFARDGLEHSGALPGELAQLVLVAADGLFLSYRAGVEIDPEEYAETVLAVIMQAIADARSSALAPDTMAP
jgi:AcrR family transcriptional regulator